MIDNTGFQTRGPIVKITQEDLLQSVILGGEQQFPGFQREIHWIADSHTRMEYFHGDEKLKDGDFCNDYYGFLTSLSAREARQYAEKYKITQESSLVLVCRTTVRLIPALATEEDKAYNADKKAGQTRYFHQVPREWLQVRKPGDTRPDYHLFFEPVVIADQITWSSRNSTVENERLESSIKDMLTNQDFPSWDCLIKKL